MLYCHIDWKTRDNPGTAVVFIHPPPAVTAAHGSVPSFYISRSIPFNILFRDDNYTAVQVSTFNYILSEVTL